MQNGLVDIAGRLGAGLGEGLAGYVDTVEAKRRRQREEAQQALEVAMKLGPRLLQQGGATGLHEAQGLANAVPDYLRRGYNIETDATPIGGAPMMTRPPEQVEPLGPMQAPGAKMPSVSLPGRYEYNTGARNLDNPQSLAAMRGRFGMAPDVPKYEERDPFKEVGFFDKQGQWHTTSAAQKKPDPYHPGQIYEADGHRWLRSPDGQTQDLGRVTYAPQAPQRPQFVTVGDQVGWAYPPAPGGAAPAKPFAPVGKRPPPTGAELAAERAAKKEQQQRVTAGGMVAAVVAKQFPWAGKATVDKTTGDVLLNIGAGSPASARELRRLETEGSGVYDVVKDPDGRTRLMITGTPDASWLRSQLRPAPDPKLVTDETNTRVEDKAGVKVAPKSGAASNRAKIFQWARAEAVRELRAGKRMGQVVTDAEIEAKSQQLFNHALETGFVPGGPEAGPGAGGDPAVRAILEEFKADRAARGKK